MNSIKRIVCLTLTVFLFCSSFTVCASAADNIKYGIGFITTPNQCLYSKPSSRSQAVDVTSENDCVVIISKHDDSWYKVSYNDQIGYLYADCVDAGTEVNAELGLGRINASVAYLRSGPGTEYSIESSGFKSNVFPVIGLYNGWYKILKDSATCYIRSDLMDLTEVPYQNEASPNAPVFYYLGKIIGELTFTETEQVSVASSGGYYAPISGSSILAAAQQYLGVPYVFGGASPSGFDCSGLVYYVLTQMGYSSYRTAADQYTMGSPVSRSSLRPGDLVFFENTYTSGVSHVGIYAGGGKFLHAPNSGSAVSYSSLSGYWAEHYCGARRLG